MMVEQLAQPPRTMHILLVEDNPADVELTEEALEESALNVTLHVVQDGVEALRFLQREGVYSGAVKTDLILLDLNLPKKDGRELLGDIKKDDDLRMIPVVVLTTSTHASDIAHAYQLHANCYVNKPGDFDDFTQLLSVIKQYWFTVVKLPTRMV